VSQQWGYAFFVRSDRYALFYLQKEGTQMKKIIATILALVMCLSLAACKSKEAKTVEELIDAIGEVTLESESAIVSAENAYNALTAEDKAEIENHEILIAARTLLDDLIYEAEMNAKYENALALLNAEDYENAYNAFIELGDWKDSLAYVDRFTVLENVILEETQILHKNLETETSTIYYEYDSQGRVIQKNGNYLDYFCFGLDAYTPGNIWTYEYDANGDLVCVNHYIDTKDLSLVIEFTYDDNHAIVAGTMTTNYDQNNLYFDYNSENNVSRIVFLDPWYSEMAAADTGWIMNYIYEDGSLIRREYCGWEGEPYAEALTDDFHLDNAREYQYDENGNCIGWAVVRGGGMNSNVESSFTYGTYYGFDLP